MTAMALKAAPYFASRPRWLIIVDPAADHRAARTRHPDAVAVEAAVQGATAFVLLEEGVEVCEQHHANESYAARRWCVNVSDCGHSARAADLAPRHERPP